MLQNVTLNTDQVSSMTYALVVDKKDANEYAKEWVSDNSSTVEDWLK